MARAILEQEEHLYCPHCGFLLVPEGLFCRSCGRPVQPVESEVPRESVAERTPSENGVDVLGGRLGIDVTFSTPPGWPPAAHPGWLPADTWSPPTDWPAPPAGWVFYRGRYGQPLAAPTGSWNPVSQAEPARNPTVPARVEAVVDRAAEVEAAETAARQQRLHAQREAEIVRSQEEAFAAASRLRAEQGLLEAEQERRREALAKMNPAHRWLVSDGLEILRGRWLPLFVMVPLAFIQGFAVRGTFIDAYGQVWGPLVFLVCLVVWVWAIVRAAAFNASQTPIARRVTYGLMGGVFAPVCWAVVMKLSNMLANVVM